MKTGFEKRIYTVAEFRRALDDVFAHLPDMRAAMRGGRVNKSFAERIMLAVTQVNGCRYCHYGHAKAALAAGITETEIRDLFEGELDKVPPTQVVALTFAQHYAETEGYPDPAAWQRVVDTYGPESARDIMAYIRMITMGNLLGNTFDALLYRLTLRPTAPGSSLVQEASVILGSLVLVPATFIRHKLRPAPPS